MQSLLWLLHVHLCSTVSSLQPGRMNWFSASSDVRRDMESKEGILWCRGCEYLLPHLWKVGAMVI